MTFETYQGDDDLLNLAIIDDAGAAIDITNYTIRLTVKKPLTSTVLFTKVSTDTNQIAKTAPYSGGLAVVKILSADTISLLGAYDFDVQLTLPSGLIKTFAKGVLKVIGDVSAP